MSAETINPRRDVPLSVGITLSIVAVTYVLSATALAGMVPTAEADPRLSFVMAFSGRGWDRVAEVRVAGSHPWEKSRSVFLWLLYPRRRRES